jgi:hypothetical protein
MHTRDGNGERKGKPVAKGRDRRVNERIILKWKLEKQSVMWIGFIWLSTNQYRVPANTVPNIWEP